MPCSCDNIERERENRDLKIEPSNRRWIATQKSTTNTQTHLSGLETPLHFVVRRRNQQLGSLWHSGRGLCVTKAIQTLRVRDISGQRPAVPHVQWGVRLGGVTTPDWARSCVCARVCQVLTTLFFFVKCRYADTWRSKSNQLKKMGQKTVCYCLTSHVNSYLIQFRLKCKFWKTKHISV